MILVAGLAAAGLVGIAAAFYFSIRSGNGYKRNSRVRPGQTPADRQSGSRADRHAGGRRSDAASAEQPPTNPRRAANTGRAANAGRATNTGSHEYRAEGRTGPNAVTDFGPAGEAERAGGQRPAPAGRRARPDSRQAPN